MRPDPATVAAACFTYSTASAPSRSSAEVSSRFASSTSALAILAETLLCLRDRGLRRFGLGDIKIQRQNALAIFSDARIVLG